MTDSVRDDLAVVRAELERMLGPGDFELPADRFQPTEHERLILRRVVELANVVDRLAAKVEG